MDGGETMYQNSLSSGDNNTMERAIKLEVDVNAPLKKVWEAWTTAQGVRTFFAPDCEIDIRVHGKYDILFFPTAPKGLRGAEDNWVLAIQEGKMFSFTWDAPPQFPETRKQRTSVVVRFVELEKNKTRIRLTHSGWGEGKEWDETFEYFISAWGDVVLPFLKYSFEVGPINWQNFPTNLPTAENLLKATRLD